MKIKEPQEWGKVTYRNFVEYGAIGILNHYSMSHVNMLKRNFPGSIEIKLFMMQRLNGKTNGLAILIGINLKINENFY